MLVAVQLSALGLYLPPVAVSLKVPSRMPPQTIISVPVHTAVCWARQAGAFVLVVAIQLSALGLYLPPVFEQRLLSSPPQTIISVPVHTAVWKSRPTGAFVVLVAIQLSVAGLYL